MQSNVPMVKLGEVLTHRSEFITIEDLSIYKRATVQYHAKGVVIRDEIEGFRIKTKKQRICKAGDFLIAEIDAKYGGVGIVPDYLDGAIVSSHYFLFDIDTTKLDRQYFDFFIRTKKFLKQINARGSTNYAATRPLDIFKINIPLPPLKEQQRIVATLERLITKIEMARKHYLDRCKEIEILFKNQQERVSSQLINDYPRIKIEQIAEVKGGKRLPNGFSFTQEKTSHPYIRVTDMQNHTVIPDGIQYLSDFVYSQISNYTISSLDLYITIAGIRIGDIGEIPIVLNGSNLTENAAKIIIKDKQSIEKRFLMHILLMPYVQKQFFNKKRIAAQPKLALHRIRSTEIVMPPLSQQCCIVAHLDRLQAKVDDVKRLQLETEREMLALVPAVLAKAFGASHEGQ